MRRLFRWIAGLVSVAALAKLLSGRRHRHDAPPAPDVAGEPDPADELRRKLAELRAEEPADAAAPTAPDAGAPSAAEVTTGGAGEEQPSIEERRAAIHARAQEAIESMKDVTS